jgi:hypothetical protein
VSVFCLGAEQIDGLWDELSPHLFRLERHGHIDAEEVRDDLKASRKQLWGYQDGAKIAGIAITRITKRGVCEIYGAAGTQTKPGQIQEVHDAIERWAKEINCTKLRLQGRRGWLRVLKGYAQTKEIILEKEI